MHVRHDGLPHVYTHTIDTIIRDCPIDCLHGPLSLITLNTLARAYDAPFDPPSTVGDAADLYLQNQLPEIRGLGPRRIGEIEVTLIFCGLVSRPASSPPGPAGVSLE